MTERERSAPFPVGKYRRLLKDPFWPQSNVAARRAIYDLLRHMEKQATRAMLREKVLKR